MRTVRKGVVEFRSITVTHVETSGLLSTRLYTGRSTTISRCVEEESMTCPEDPCNVLVYTAQNRLTMILSLADAIQLDTDTGSDPRCAQQGWDHLVCVLV